jgi:hypothetical protein
VFDATQSYVPAFVTFVVVTSAVLVAMLLFSPRDDRQAA